MYPLISVILLITNNNREYFQPLGGKVFPNKNLKGMKDLETGVCYWLVKVTTDQLEPCRSDVNTSWHQHHDSTAKVNEYKTVQVPGNGVTIGGHIVHFSGCGLSLSRSRHTLETCGDVVNCRLTFAWLTLKSQERPRAVFRSRMKPNIHLAISWRETLPINKGHT